MGRNEKRPGPGREEAGLGGTVQCGDEGRVVRKATANGNDACADDIEDRGERGADEVEPDIQRADRLRIARPPGGQDGAAVAGGAVQVMVQPFEAAGARECVEATGKAAAAGPCRGSLPSGRTGRTRWRGVSH